MAPVLIFQQFIHHLVANAKAVRQHALPERLIGENAKWCSMSMNWEAERRMARDVEENKELYAALADEPEASE